VRSRSRSIGCAVVAVLVATTTAADGAQDRNDSERRLDVLRSWLTAVQRHEPGELDAALVSSTAWTGADLARLHVDLQALFMVAHNPTVRRVVVFPPMDRLDSGPKHQPAGTTYDAAILQQLREIAKFVRQAEPNTVAKRGILFHTDVVTHGLDANESAAVAGPVSGSLPYKVRIEDGKFVEISYAPLHWEVARALVAQIKPNPSQDVWVRDWYRATVAYLQDEHEYGTDHVRHALDVFPADPQLLFLAGCLHEVLASPSIQSFVTTSLASKVRVGVAPANRERASAERFFERALDADPGHTEARIRLARVLSLRDERREAAAHLRAALETRPEPLLAYYANLFLGTSLMSLQDRDGARDAYGRAVELYPRSQAGNLALAEIAWRSGERSEMVGHLGRAVGGEERTDDDDPWRTYYVAQARRAGAMLDAVRESFRRPVK
jgi:hypothetical protein